MEFYGVYTLVPFDKAQLSQKEKGTSHFSQLEISETAYISFLLLHNNDHRFSSFKTAHIIPQFLSNQSVATAHLCPLQGHHKVTCVYGCLFLSGAPGPCSSSHRNRQKKFLRVEGLRLSLLEAVYAPCIVFSPWSFQETVTWASAQPMEVSSACWKEGPDHGVTSSSGAVLYWLEASQVHPHLRKKELFRA